MKEIYEYPPNIDAIRAVLDIPPNGVVFTYGDILFNPDRGYIDGSLWAHEETHARQQMQIGVENWWEEYLTNDDFRLKQELEAYQNQYKHYCSITPNREKRIVFLVRLARDLASPMYGSTISIKEAMEQIKHGIIQKSGAVQFGEERTGMEEYTKWKGW